MENAVERIKKVLGEVVSIKATMIAEKTELIKEAEKQAKTRTLQSKKGAELTKREKAIKPIEDVLAYENALKAMAKETKKESIALEKNKQAFEVYKKEEWAKITERTNFIALEEKRYQRELEGLKKAREAVALQKVNIKQAAIAELVNKA
jgi:hypothetical protein